MADATTLIDYMLNRYQNVLENLIINQKQMLNNIYSTNGVLFAQYVMHALINKGIVREKAYDLIQPIAIKSYNEHIDFKNMLLTNKDICKILTKKEIDQCFDIEKCLSNVDHIYIINGMRS
jgi:adenylosuccinate lyase